MPGILPMKVIKVGASAQARIAQACDRCRSKKIRCDGMRPCCSQCANVGFECKTSDKLSRRAFPRGYTESLEERVRGLEAEVRELKELLDEKDEKIDMLSRIHSQSSQAIQLPSPRRPSTASLESGATKPETPEKDEVFKVQQSPCLLSGAGDGADSYFSGTSSVRTFIEAFKHRVQEGGRSTIDIKTDHLLSSSLRRLSNTPSGPASPVVFKAPPRLVSDQLVNIFFQEWAPLFPVLHRPTFLSLYEKYVADADAVTDKTAIAQLNLVFGIAALSYGPKASADLESFEAQWRAAIDAILTENSLATLQALILAQIFCVQQGDFTRLLTYKALSTTLSARLGLHQSQKRFALGTLTSETRKKVFWTLYTVDSFTAVLLGLPKHLKDEDVHCEYPVDADDEYVTERGFQPTLPGESTKLSSALALFRAARILTRVLEEVYPAKTSYELSMKKLADLSDDLDAWCNSLAPHLRLHFAQDKPSTGTISSRSPLLSLTYHYIRALIYRPVTCASLTSNSSPAMMKLASSCKHMIQILQLLEERGMSFSFCLNQDELLVFTGFGLLFQGLDLDPSSKILKDNQKMITAVIGILSKSKARCTADFARVARSFLPQSTAQIPRITTPPVVNPHHTVSRHNSDPSISAPSAPNSSSTRKQLKAIASRITNGVSSKTPRSELSPDHRRATIHAISLHPNGVASQSQPSLQPQPRYNPASISRSEPARSPISIQQASLKPASRPQMQTPNFPNLDYLSFDNETFTGSHNHISQPVKPEPQPTDWEKLLGSLDNGTTNIYDACYGGPAIDALLDSPAMGIHPNHSTTAIGSTTDWDSDLWALCQTQTNTSDASGLTASNGHPDSLLSFSTDEATSSVDDLVNGDWGSVSSSGGTIDVYRGIVMPAEIVPSDELPFAGVWDTAAALS
ncbi:hypothetical protein M433DRAFT_60738 [Acidomyces richmondensis BFW]|nr:MAG: hypothetical protein FE78DRAFT_136109 [Acidomyces sp. 'richmondensis']KYG48633.1 hypothetical protein M433DRAFT_60738 [Acidomyces richmondensis BFW]